MFASPEATQWQWSMSFKHSVDFALWIIEKDGLPVDGFEPMTEGNRELSAVGLTAQKWSAWLRSLASKEITHAQNLPFWQSKATLPPELANPHAYFEHETSLKAALKLHWYQYLSEAFQRSKCTEDLHKEIAPTPQQGAHFWQTVQGARGTVPSLNIILTGYPIYTEYHLAPSTLILAPGGKCLKHDDLCDIFVRTLQTMQKITA